MRARCAALNQIAAGFGNKSGHASQMQRYLLDWRQGFLGRRHRLKGRRVRRIKAQIIECLRSLNDAVGQIHTAFLLTRTEAPGDVSMIFEPADNPMNACWVTCLRKCQAEVLCCWETYKSLVEALAGNYRKMAKGQ